MFLMRADTLRRLGWFAGLSLLFYLAALPLGVTAQAELAGALILVLFLLSSSGRFSASGNGNAVQQWVRVCIVLLAVFVTLRYFFWRTTTTIEYVDLPSFLAAILLYLAEIYGITIYFLGSFVSIFPLHRVSPPLPEDPAELPSVDILIPSYNEDPELLAVTLLAATQVNYPQEKLTVYLLDDGGTEQKRNDADPLKAAQAEERHHTLKALAERVGARYLTRARNTHAKAGNINDALPNCHGDLVLILDADHVPTADILQKTVGFFIRDPKLFLVQTPHYFINPDPIERNLDTFSNMPSENEMFYSVIQHGLDFWGGSFFCGSAALLRRRYMDEIGGISGETITEDAETALSLHARGYHSVYLGTPLISGLQPETFSGFVLQRVRWAQGMVQIFLLKNPLLVKGLKLPQRLAYTSSSFFWFFPFARSVFLLAPAAFLLFGFQIYNANLQEFFAYALPHIAAAMLLSNFLYGKTRWPFVSELYETMQSLFSLLAIFQVFLSPRAPTFQVTPKGERLDSDFVSSLAKPFYLLFAITVLCLVGAALRIHFNPEEFDVAMITGGWALFNLILLTGALGALFERRQRRLTPRINMPMDLPVTVELDDEVIDGRLFDVSSTGAGLTIADGMTGVPAMEGSDGAFIVDNPGLGRVTRIPCKVRRVFSVSEHHLGHLQRITNRLLRRKTPVVEHIQMGVEFRPTTTDDWRAIVALVFGDSRVLERNLSRRQNPLSIPQSLRFLVGRGLVHSVKHFAQLFQHLYLWLLRRQRTEAMEG